MSSRYSYGINPIVGIRLNVEYMFVIITIIMIIQTKHFCGIQNVTLINIRHLNHILKRKLLAHGVEPALMQILHVLIMLP